MWAVKKSFCVCYCPKVYVVSSPRLSLSLSLSLARSNSPDSTDLLKAFSLKQLGTKQCLNFPTD